MRLISRIIAAASLGALVLVLASCNTTRGVGRDIEKAGDGLKESAERNGAD